jgi:hypothetical protein
MQTRETESLKIDPEVFQRFIQLVQGEIGANETDCNMWKGSRTSATYWQGRFWIYNRRLPAHKVSYEWFREHIPPGKRVVHTCKKISRGGCVNPHHLKLVDMKISTPKK